MKEITQFSEGISTKETEKKKSEGESPTSN